MKKTAKSKPAKKKPAVKNAALKKAQPGRVDKKEAFLAAFIRTASLTLAAKAVDMDRRQHYNWLAEDPAYVKAFEAARIEAVQTLEDEAIRRAVHGVLEPVFYQGEMCGTIVRYSDGLLMQQLRAHDPDKYRERVSAELTGKDGAPLEAKAPFPEWLLLLWKQNAPQAGSTNPSPASSDSTAT